MRTRNFFQKLLMGLLLLGLFVIPGGFAAQPAAARQIVEPCQDNAPCVLLRPGPAAPADNDSGAGHNRAVVLNLQPGEAIYHFVVDSRDAPLFNEWGAPTGALLSYTVQGSDGKPVELFLPLSVPGQEAGAKENRIFRLNAGREWELLATVAPTQAAPDTEIRVDNVAILE